MKTTQDKIYHTLDKEIPFLTLSEREKDFLKKREAKQTLFAIGQAENPPITRERVRQIITRAKEKQESKKAIIDKIFRKINQHYNA